MSNGCNNTIPIYHHPRNTQNWLVFTIQSQNNTSTITMRVQNSGLRNGSNSTRVSANTVTYNNSKTLTRIDLNMWNN